MEGQPVVLADPAALAETHQAANPEEKIGVIELSWIALIESGPVYVA
jgi:hypothetical protein